MQGVQAQPQVKARLRVVTFRGNLDLVMPTFQFSADGQKRKYVAISATRND